MIVQFSLEAAKRHRSGGLEMSRSRWRWAPRGRASIMRKPANELHAINQARTGTRGNVSGSTHAPGARRTRRARSGGDGRHVLRRRRAVLRALHRRRGACRGGISRIVSDPDSTAFRQELPQPRSVTVLSGNVQGTFRDHVSTVGPSASAGGCSQKMAV